MSPERVAISPSDVQRRGQELAAGAGLHPEFFVALFRGRSAISRIIQWVTLGRYSHAGLVGRVPERVLWQFLDQREFRGGMVQDLATAISPADNGRVDLFGVCAERWPDFKPAQALSRMADICRRPYATAEAASLLLRRLPIAWRWIDSDTDDRRKSQRAFCSWAVAESLAAGGIDPCRNLPHRLVTPTLLSHSLLLEYVCTM